MGNTCFKWLILLVCMAAYANYGLVQTFGGFLHQHLTAWYELTPAEAHRLYFFLTLGDAGLSFIPGLCFDLCGAWRTSLLGLMFGVIPFSSHIIRHVIDPNAHFARRSLWLLDLHLMAEGLCASFLDVICSIVPLLVFEKQNVGKVSAALQVSKALGLAIQGALAEEFFHSDHAVIHRDIFILALLLLFFPSMAVLFWWTQDMIEHKESSVEDGKCQEPTPSEDATSTSQDPTQAMSPASEDENELSLTFLEILCKCEFWYIAMTFLVTLGFYYSFLELEVSIAGTLGVSSSGITVPFGIMNAFTRVIGSVSLDCTQKYRFGGGLTYMVISQAVFASGLCLLVLPASPTSLHMSTANLLCAVGFGGTLGLVPPTLRILFGAQHLGKIYGGLYMGVAISLPFWTALSGASSSQRFDTYRSYLIGGCIGLSCMVGLGVLAIILPHLSCGYRSPLTSDVPELDEELQSAS